MEARKYVVLVFMFLLHFSARTTWAFNYANALAKTLLFYEAQRSGRLPSNQRANWRGDSGLQDGRTEGVDLVGGYYDAGDNVKFGLPMAFTITMLSWSAIEYKNQLQRTGQYGYTLEAIKWGTDYFIKAHPEPNVLWGEVGDGVTDHECWQRPEDMTTSRRAYRIDTNNPGSDLAGETAAAMAAASICFRDADPNYANSLVQHAKQLFIFADRYRGKYDSSIRIAQNFYTSKSGYMDELLWAAIWLYKATKDHQYLAYLAINAATHGGIGWSVTEFTWDVKYAGVQVLASKILMEGKGGFFTLPLQQYQSKAEYFLCACLQKNYGLQVQRTPGGLMYVRSWNNLQYVVASSFLLTVYSDYLASARQELQCPRGRAQPSELFNFAKSQVDYILGNNPRATSYMVGYGSNYPRQVHHRASSIVSIKVNNQFVSCLGGYNTWYNRKMSDPNVLNGAVVGGPDQNDNFADERYNYEQTEPASYNSGPLVGILARLQQGASRDFSSDSQMSNFTGTSTPLLETSEVSMINFDSELVHPYVAPMPGLMIEIEQTRVASWQKRGKNYFKYAATITNKSNTTLSSLFLKINRLHGPAWGLSRTSRGSRTFTFPQWLQSLEPQKSFTFVYIHSAPRAEISVASYKIV